MRLSFASAFAAAVLVVVDLASVVFVSARVATRFCPQPAQRLERWTVGVLVGVLDVVLVSQLTSAVTIFSRGWVLVGHVVVAAAAAAHGRLRPVEARPVLREPVTGPREGGALRQRITAGAVIGLAVAFSVTGVVVALSRSTVDYDTLNYHLPNAIHFVTTGSVWGLPITVPPFATNAYPGNGELLGAWLMLPTHSPALALLEPVPFAALCILGVALTAKRLGGSPYLGAGAALAIVGSPTFYIWVDSMLTDFAGGAGLITGLALMLPKGSAGRRRWLVLAGLAVGLSLGAKDTAAGPALVAVCLVAGLGARGRRWREVAIFVVAVAMPSAIWYVRDWIALGNPVFPAGVKVFGHTVFTGLIGFATRYEAPLSYHLVHLDGGALHVWVDGVRNFLGPIIVLSVAASIVAVVGGVRRRDRALGAVAVVAVMWSIAYAITPTTGGGLAGNPVLITAQLRYDLPALLVGSALAAVVLRRWLAEAAITACVAFDIYKINSYTGLFPYAHRQAALIVACLLAGPVLLVAARRRSRLGHAGGRLGRLARRWSSVGVPARAALAVASAVGAILVVGGLLRSRPVPAPSALRSAMGGRAGTVVVANIKDVNSVIGPQLANRVVSLQGSGADHENVTDPRGALQDAIRRYHPQSLVLGADFASSPPSYRPAGTLRSPSGTPVGTIYVPATPPRDRSGAPGAG